MTTKSLAPIFLLLVLVALAPGSAVAQQGSTADGAAGSCGAANPITPGVTVTDDLSDELAAHTDIAKVSTSISGGKILTAVFHLRDLPADPDIQQTGRWHPARSSTVGKCGWTWTATREPALWEDSNTSCPPTILCPRQTAVAISLLKSRADCRQAPGPWASTDRTPS